jgi:hypothetical protein
VPILIKNSFSLLIKENTANNAVYLFPGKGEIGRRLLAPNSPLYRAIPLHKSTKGLNDKQHKK